MRALTFRERVLLLKEFVLGARLLRRSPFLSRDEMRRWQLERIRTLVGHAYESVPLYRELYGAVGFEPGDLKSWSDFEQLPLVSKEEMIESFPERIVSDRFEFDRLIVSRSSGSSGKVLDVAYDGRTMIAYVLASLRIYQMGFRYRPWHRHVYIYTSPYPLSSVFGMYPLRFVSTLTPIDEVLRVLVATRPQLLICYPSHLRQIVDLAAGPELAQIRPLLISVSSEMSSQGERDYLEAAFRCPVLDNYSSEEMARIASQCSEKVYHVFEDMNYIETLDSNARSTTGLGAVVGTNLHNFAAPLIRYQQNDLAQLTEPGCACGWNFRCLRSLQGRRNDSFRMPSGRILTSGFLLDATYEFLLGNRTAIRDFCLVQESERSILLEIVPGRGWSEEVGRGISGRFFEFVDGGVAFRVELVAECEKTRTGKRNPIINRMARDDTARVSDGLG
jgi:phenylacetate-CoA ligase